MADLVAGDTLPTLETTCKDKDTGAVIDLSAGGAWTAVLRFRFLRGKEKRPSDLKEQSMAVDADPTTGKVSYQFATGELLDGTLQYEVKLTDPSGKTTTSIEVGELETRAALA